MNILEAIQSNEALANISSNALSKALIDRGISDHSLEYSSSSLKSIELVTADLYLQIIAQPDFKEGSLAISYNRDYLMNYVRAIAKKYNDDTLLKASNNNLGAIEAVNLW